MYNSIYKIQNNNLEHTETFYKLTKQFLYIQKERL